MYLNAQAAGKEASKNRSRLARFSAFFVSGEETSDAREEI